MRALCAAAILAGAPPSAGAAALPADGSSIDAPGLTAGPFITSVGLVWQGPAGVMLTDAAGVPSVLSPTDVLVTPGGLPNASVGTDWWAVTRASGVWAGPIGGRLTQPPLLQRCSSFGEARLYAVSGEHLLAGLPRRCLATRSSPAGEVVDFDLRTGHARAVTAAPPDLLAIAASGNRLAELYATGGSRLASPLVVRVIDLRTGRPLYVATGPAPDRSVPLLDSSVYLQVDGFGDALVTSRQFIVPALVNSAWWTTPASHEWMALPAGTGNRAVLSDGRLASLEYDAGSAAILLRDVRSAASRVVVSFTGTVDPDGLALSGNALAWWQQSSYVNAQCTTGTLSPPQLASLDLRELPAAPIGVTGVAAPPVPAVLECPVVV